MTLTSALGAASQLLAGRTAIPGFITMLALGIVGGLVLRSANSGNRHGGLAELFHLPAHGALISLDLILFVLLPPLICESVFNFDTHVFRKNLSGVSVLAVPASAVTILLPGLFMFGVTHWSA